jgi:hypothetical protein
MHFLLTILLGCCVLLAGCEAGATQAPKQKPARPKRMLELQVSATTIRAFDPLIAKVLVYNPRPSGQHMFIRTVPSEIGFAVRHVASKKWRDVPSKETPLDSTDCGAYPGIIIPAGETRIVSYQVLFQPETWELTTPGEYLLSATMSANMSPPVRIRVVDCQREERNQIESQLPYCYAAIGLDRTFVLHRTEPTDRLVLPPVVDLTRLESIVRDLERKLRSPSKLKQTLRWTLAFGKLKETATVRTRRETLAEILKIRDECDPLTQEAIEASLLNFMRFERLEPEEGEKIVRRRWNLVGEPWDKARKGLARIREMQRQAGWSPPKD